MTNLPIETGSRLQRPLLNNVINWLIETRQRDDEFDEQRNNFREAGLVALKVQAQALPWEELKPAMQNLVAKAKLDIWKEESLWFAGESYQQMCYMFNWGSLIMPTYAYPARQTLESDPQFYKQLVERFPESPLKPFAQWRLGECERRNQFNISLRNPGARYLYEVDPVAPIKAYQQVDAPRGSYAWAWANLRLGRQYLKSRNPIKAIPHFQEVSEHMSAGPEKAIAVLALGYSYQKLFNPAEAKRYFESVLTLPNMNWWNHDFYTAWAPLNSSGMEFLGNNKSIAQGQLRRLANTNRQPTKNSSNPRNQRNQAVALNQAAWLLATTSDPMMRDPERAVQLAKRAVELAPEEGGYWNTLGVAQFYASQWNESIESLNRSEKLLNGNQSSFNTFFLAMCYWKLDNKDEARKFYDNSVIWMEKNKPDDSELIRFRKEATELLEIQK